MEAFAEDMQESLDVIRFTTLQAVSLGSFRKLIVQKKSQTLSKAEFDFSQTNNAGSLLHGVYM